MFVLSNAFSQDSILSKKGEPYLPQKGDWAISIDASPFLKYAGNFIGGNGLNVAPTFNLLSTNQVILGKYFIEENTALRGGILIGINSQSTTNTQVPKIPYTSPLSYVEDVTSNNSSNMGLTAGIEFRKGKTRLQGYYGAEAGFALGSSSTTKTYGNAISAANPTNQLSKVKSGSTLSIGLRGFVGAEYFILPKISLGGEFGWGLAMASTGEGEMTTQGWSGSEVKTTTTKTGSKSSSFSIESENLNSIFGPAGTIRLTVHF